MTTRPTRFIQTAADSGHIKKNKRKTRGVIAVVKREGCARVFSVAYFFLFLLFVSIRISSFFKKKMYFFLCLIFRRVLLLDLLEMAVAAWAFCRRLLLLSSSFFFNNFFYVVAFLVVAVVAVVVVVVVRPLRASFAVSVSFGHRSNLKKKTNRKMNKKWFSISNDSLLRQKKNNQIQKKESRNQEWAATTSTRWNLDQIRSTSHQSSFEIDQKII